MKILILNSGSSSLKGAFFKKIKKNNFLLLANLHVDNIKKENCKFTFKSNKKNIGQKYEIKNHKQGLKLFLETLLKTNLIKTKSEIKLIGHRVVHGEEKYIKATKITPEVIKKIEKLSSLAPLHNPINLKVIKSSKKLFPKIKQIAVFDTAFYNTIPEKAFLYGLPYSFYKKHKIRKYGFHGTNHKYIINEAIELLNKKTKKEQKIISCHLGNGSSITASIDGKAVDTSMGFTPLEGIIMGTRSGSIDPAIIFHIEKNLKMKNSEIHNLLNNESGLKGLSEISSDMRKIYEKSLKGNKKAQLTIEILSYQIAKYCGGFAAATNGLSCIIFSGGLGENAFYVREKVCEYLEFLGVKINKKLNQKNNLEISTNKSKIKILIIPANEELQIAKEISKI